jgi:phosphoglycerol transferase MdoB-like AlkP superfamily enzyme
MNVHMQLINKVLSIMGIQLTLFYIQRKVLFNTVFHVVENLIISLSYSCVVGWQVGYGYISRGFVQVESAVMEVAATSNSAKWSQQWWKWLALYPYIWNFLILQDDKESNFKVEIGDGWQLASTWSHLLGSGGRGNLA